MADVDEMVCNPIRDINVTIRAFNPRNTTYNTSVTFDDRFNSIQTLEEIVHTKIILVAAIFGVLGNILNLFILTSKSLTQNMGRMETSGHVGLISLAVSDLMFCIVVMPRCFFYESRFQSRYRDFRLVYEVYGETFINMFQMSSSYVTVTLACTRYLAICHPFKARALIGQTFAIIAAVLAYTLSVLFNLPRFWESYVDSMECQEGYRMYFLSHAYFKRNPKSNLIYLWFYFTIGIIVPLVVLIYCNFFLMRELRNAKRMRKECAHQSGQGSKKDSSHLLTLTLTFIVVFYLILVSPAEINNFLKHVIFDNAPGIAVYNLITAIANALQAFNYAINFILYCSVNSHFRATVKDFVLCRKLPRHSRESPKSAAHSKTATTHVLEIEEQIPLQPSRFCP